MLALNADGRKGKMRKNMRAYRQGTSLLFFLKNVCPQKIEIDNIIHVLSQCIEKPKRCGNNTRRLSFCGEG